MKYKTCSSCGKTMGANAGNFAPYAGRSVDGLRPICRGCVRAYDRERKHRKYHATK